MSSTQALQPRADITAGGHVISAGIDVIVAGKHDKNVILTDHSVNTAGRDMKSEGGNIITRSQNIITVITELKNLIMLCRKVINQGRKIQTWQTKLACHLKKKVLFKAKKNAQ